MNLDLFWLKGETLEDSGILPEPNEMAEEISEDLQTVPESSGAVAKGLKEQKG